MDTTVARAAARRSLDGLSVGDALGELCFRISPIRTAMTDLPDGQWPWTDDTHMALSIVEVLETFGQIDQDAIAGAFARRYAAEPYRGYGRRTMQVLTLLAKGVEWRHAAPRLSGGGSYGNGAAMRAAPIGGYFGDDLAEAARMAQLSAEVTHAHPEGQAGAMAVAVAAALAARRPVPTTGDFLREIAGYLPPTQTKVRIEQATRIPRDDVRRAMTELGTSLEMSAQDTVPFCLWSAAHRLDDFAGAIWDTVKWMADRDTAGAIVGGIVALSAPQIPPQWMERREPLQRKSSSYQ